MDTKWLEKPLGPLPVWGWAVAIGGAVIAFIVLPKVLSKFGGQSQDSGTSNAGLGIDPSTGLPTGLLPGGGTAGTADQSNLLNQLLTEEQAIVSGQQAMQDEFKKFMDEVLGIRNGLTPPTSPPDAQPPVRPPDAQPPVLPPGPVPPGPTGPPVRPPGPVPPGPTGPPVRPPAQRPPNAQPPVRPAIEVDPWGRFRPGPGYVPPGGWLPTTGPIPVQGEVYQRR